MIKFISTLTFVSLSGMVFSQETWLQFPARSKDSARSANVVFDYNEPDGKVIFIEDTRLNQLADFVRAGENSIEGVKIDGFRILIFFDQSKSSAEQQKSNFMSHYADHKTYIDYVAPNYRVRAGNFRTKLEAEALKVELLYLFPTAIIVEDKIQLPQLP